MNLVVSNVPGPRTPFYVAGARLLAIYSVGPILEGIGLNITVWSYLDRMSFAAIACPESMPDLHAVTDGLAAALQELVTLAEPTPRTEQHGVNVLRKRSALGPLAHEVRCLAGVGRAGADQERGFGTVPGEAAAGPTDAVDPLEHGAARLLGLGVRPVERLDVPVAQHDRHEDLVVVDLEVVDAGPGDGLGVGLRSR